MTSAKRGKTVGRITIIDGSIQVKGVEVGRVDHQLKHGYHPAVFLKIGDKFEWFEQDTPNLIDRVFEKAKEFLEGVAR